MLERKYSAQHVEDVGDMSDDFELQVRVGDMGGVGLG